jgi:hypothetical protein
MRHDSAFCLAGHGQPLLAFADYVLNRVLSPLEVYYCALGNPTFSFPCFAEIRRVFCNLYRTMGMPDIPKPGGGVT